MSRAPHLEEWQRFVLQYGRGAKRRDLAIIVGQTERDVEKLRQTGACRRLPTSLGFAELFALRYGRSPADADWPPPTRTPKRGTYEWQAREDALIASLVGQLGPVEIAAMLTTRLRKVTGDRRATRTRNAVLVRLQRLGLQTSDVVGGITVTDAGREIGSVNIIRQAINSKTLRARRVGRFDVISHAEWARWKARRTPPPRGYVQLSSIRELLAIRSDAKLPEFASSGYIPTAILCRNPHQPRAHSTGRGSWYVDAKVAKKLVRDRRAGRTMPWHGQPNTHNLKVCFRKWQERKHPTECEECATIWGRAGAPRSFDDYVLRYPTIALGAKRHLTRIWKPGLTIAEAARHCGANPYQVRTALEAGTLTGSVIRGRLRITKTEAVRWKARRCPTGRSRKSWISFATARKLYGFTSAQLRHLIAEKRLRSRVIPAGPARGKLFVPKAQVAVLRERIGLTLSQAARHIGVSPAKMKRLLGDAEWRGTTGIPLVTIDTVKKRLASAKLQGFTVQQAAGRLKVPVEWVKERIKAGDIRMLKSSRDRRASLVTEPMLRRLAEIRARRRPTWRERFGPLWLNISEASLDAGVSITTIRRWHAEGAFRSREAVSGPRLHRRSVRARARRYWSLEKGARLKRAYRPAWLEERPQ